MNRSLVSVRILVAGLLAATLWAPRSACGAGVTQTLALANQALQAGEADKALQEIASLPQGGTGSAQAQNLACRVHYALQQWDAAVTECERATRLDNQDSAYHLWLGRALGLKADHVSFVTAYSLGKRVLVEFETAARLNPRSPDALMDLGEFYKQAPGIVGGGLDKAEKVATQLEAVDPARAHQLRARIAESRGDYGTAEREFKESIATAAHPALHWTTLASFYRARKRWADMDSAIHNSEGAALKDKHAAVALYDGAGILIESKRDPGTAARLLEEYLASPMKTEEGPAFEAHVRLARMKKLLGDSNGAQQEIGAALALAHDYKPALEFNR